MNECLAQQVFSPNINYVFSVVSCQFISPFGLMGQSSFGLADLRLDLGSHWNTPAGVQRLKVHETEGRSDRRSASPKVLEIDVKHPLETRNYNESWRAVYAEPLMNCATSGCCISSRRALYDFWLSIIENTVCMDGQWWSIVKTE